MAGNAAEAGRSVTSKVIGILLNFTSGSEYSLSEIARLTGMPVSTTHRLVAQLLEAGMLVRTRESCYRPGAQLRQIAPEAASVSASLHERARRVLEDLAAACPRETVRLGVMDGLEVAFLEKVDAARPVSMLFETVTEPLHATAMGKILLAFAGPEIVGRVVAAPLRSYTTSTITCQERLEKALVNVRHMGIAVSWQELEIGRFEVAVPVWGPGKTVAAAVQVSRPKPWNTRLVQPALTMAARTLSYELQVNDPRYAVVVGTERKLEVLLRSAFLAGQHEARMAESGRPTDPGKRACRASSW